MKKAHIRHEDLNHVHGGKEVSFVDLSNGIVDYERLQASQASLQETAVNDALVKEGVSNLIKIGLVVFGIWKKKETEKIESLKKKKLGV